MGQEESRVTIPIIESRDVTPVTEPRAATPIDKQVLVIDEERVMIMKNNQNKSELIIK
ncbi:10061_t:CDS:2 [Funneliformis caledonium]|uniref:10061_t:CDS:1 n=1 Tax=Funneliformis caledonium TaxID=1117310 RepID=A0A9N8VZF3_9GLOM|nr:10061_t:CDS:2 [Funneliformis caledonium]